MGIVENQVRPRSEAKAEEEDLRDAAVGSLVTGPRDREEEPHSISSFLLAKSRVLHGGEEDNRMSRINWWEVNWVKHDTG